MKKIRSHCVAKKPTKTKHQIEMEVLKSHHEKVMQNSELRIKTLTAIGLK